MVFSQRAPPVLSRMIERLPDCLIIERGYKMKFINLGSISKNLALLVMLAVLPALAILCYAGLEERRTSIKTAKHDVSLLAHSMAEAQNNINRSTQQFLSTLALLPEVQNLNLQASQELFKEVLVKNPDYLNLSLIDLKGEVIAADKLFTATNLMDRKHVREAMEKKSFAVGEYIVTRIGTSVPALAFAYPVLDHQGEPKAVLTTVISLSRFANFYDTSSLPEKSFVAVTDHKGLRLFYYPANERTNPVGKPIRTSAWEKARNAQKPGTFISEGSDGTRRIFAFEQVRLTPDAPPALYVWAAVPEAIILGPANTALIRNTVLMVLATGMSLAIALAIAQTTLLSPIAHLIALSRKFAMGNLDARSNLPDTSEEFRALTTSFHDMAAALSMSKKTLLENEARFRIVMDSLDAIVYVADMNTYEVLFINEHGKKLFGDATGKICWQSLQQGQSAPCPFCTNKFLVDEQGNPAEVYQWESRNTLTRRWQYMQDRAIRWVDGHIVRLQVATDISARKLAEANLADETERLTVTLRSIGDGVITTDTDGRVLLVNKVAEMLTGWRCIDAAGRPLEEIFHIINGESRQPCASPLTIISSSEEISDLASHTILIAKDGQERTIAESGAPIRDKEGTIIGMVLVFRDITEQLHTEQELLKVKKLESIGVLAGGIAHDFNNILTAIIGNIDMSLLDSKLTEQTRNLLQEAEKASWRARDLTQQLLTFAKGGQPIKETAALADVVKDSADFVLRGGKVACRYEFPDDLWLVDIDKGQISQVVQNIILNARNAMPSGGVILVSCKNIRLTDSQDIDFLPHGDYVKMSITDSGVGIAANLLDKIFDPYFSTQQQGSGLGLAITHSIISKHGGHISVQSTLGAGSTFTVYLPASQQGFPLVETPTTTAKSTRTSTILVMDDEEPVREFTQAFLGHLGHQVLLAQDGEEALRIYKQAADNGTRIDLTIMDLTIPGGMGGEEAMKHIIAIDPQARVIVSSGYSNNPVLSGFKNYGFCAAITKPYKLSELSKVIDQFLG